MKRFLPRSLTGRISGALLVASIVPTLVIGAVAVTEVRSTLAQAAREQHRARITSLAQDLNTVLQESRRSLDTAAALPAVRSGGQSRAEVLAIMARREPLFRALYFMDQSGALVEAAGEASPGLRGRHPASYGGYVTDAYDSDGTLIVTVIVGVRDENLRVVGYLCGDIDLAVMRELAASSPLPPESRLLIVDANRRVIAAVPETSDSAHLQPAIERVHSTLAAGERTFRDTDGREWLAVYQNMGAYDEFRGLRWGIVLAQETRYAFAAAQRTALRIALLFVLFLLGCIGVGNFMARGLARPLERLGEQAEKVAAGGVGETVRAPGMPEEIAHLAARFDEMAQRVSRSRAALESLHELYSSLVRAIPVGVASVDASGRLQAVNPVFLAMAGVAYDTELLGVSLLDGEDARTGEAAIRLADAIREAMESGAPVEHTLDQVRLPLSGEPVARLRFRVAPLETRGAVVLLEDASAQAEMESLLVRSEKLSSVGVLAAGVAHEINNPMTTILGYSQLLLEDHPPGDAQHDPLALIVDEATRVRTIVHNLLDFSRPTPGGLLPVDLNAAIGKIMSVMGPQFRKARVALDCNLAATLPLVQGDARRIQQIVLNLATNAADAAGTGGHVRIETQPADEGVVLRVADDGTGIPEDVLPKIFDPFFTTKAPGRGTGLGLAVTHRIVEEHRATIDIETGETGTTFTVQFRIADPARIQESA